MGVFVGNSTSQGGYFFRNALNLDGDMSLTDTAIRQARPKDKAYRLSDEKGLFLFVTPAGGKRRPRWHRASPATPNWRFSPSAIRVEGKRGSSLPYNLSSRR